jgi:hypothetical protein
MIKFLAIFGALLGKKLAIVLKTYVIILGL